MFISFTNVWMILNYFRKIESEWPMQIVADATFRFCDRDIGLVGIGIVLPGGKFQPLNYSLVPTESAQSYSLAWASYEKSAIYFARKFRHCEDRTCTTCADIDNVLHAARVRELLRSDAVQQENRLPVDCTISDNNKAWQHVATHDMGLLALKCITHLTGCIPLLLCLPLSHSNLRVPQP